MNTSIKAILTLTIAVMAAGCSTSGKDRVTSTPNFAAADLRVWDRPHQATLEVKTEEVTGKTSTFFILGFSFGANLSTPNLVKLNSEGGATGYSTQVLAAAADAQDQAKADAFQIKRASVTESGLWPFFWTETATVSGNPVMMKFASVSADDADTRRLRNLTGTGGVGGDPCLFRLGGFGFFCN